MHEPGRALLDMHDVLYYTPCDIGAFCRIGTQEEETR